MINEVPQNKCLLLLHSGLIVNIDGEDKKVSILACPSLRNIIIEVLELMIIAKKKLSVI